MGLRLEVWNLLSNEWKVDNLGENSKEISLEELNNKIDMILKGILKGRTIVNLDI